MQVFNRFKKNLQYLRWISSKNDIKNTSSMLLFLFKLENGPGTFLCSNICIFRYGYPPTVEQWKYFLGT